ncbi:MAG: hypothetical protein COU06_00280 [Candidatus Harrisonbacteria bacterium CG10_big_fil_rev_8_21_14_0_10_38_8]|uniref:Uncharacterized protein n=1 Tax=Candidatus Harrisonbacteria bacterium CG10_big_fil_rev_8_21_14_0_10_38_8 TaxID=1974582 RepID=A0A2M6WKT7_9BACT|nr:MAG: hypothetical protein COU06_00280 [Candidatus Harrisonbacteria bacterium CG10_big_fil_rev_8_21_14_0_10_38_8]
MASGRRATSEGRELVFEKRGASRTQARGEAVSKDRQEGRSQEVRDGNPPSLTRTRPGATAPGQPLRANRPFC